jgi:hypothetical protein
MGEFGSMEGFELELTCGHCHERLKAPQELLRFAVCKCPNRAQICLQNREHMAHLLGAKDEVNAFVHVLAINQKPLPPIPLSRWNQLQQRFKRDGHLYNVSDQIQSNQPTKPTTQPLK